MLLTRSPLFHVDRSPEAFDLHVLSPPLAFALSQDQTLQFNLFVTALQFTPCFRLEFSVRRRILYGIERKLLPVFQRSIARPLVQLRWNHQVRSTSQTRKYSRVSIHDLMVFFQAAQEKI